MKGHIDTLCVQEGFEPKSGEPRVTPICQSTTYVYESAEALAALFDLKGDGYFYSRLANPTVAALERKITALEGGVAGVGVSSGQTASMLTVMNVAHAGDNILCSSAVYGGTYNLFAVTLQKYGIETRFFSPNATAEDIVSLIDGRTRLIFAETIANPAIVVLDFEKLATIARKHKILFAVDNTLATPILCRPLEHGANVVLHSTTKYIDGHAVAVGGMIIDGGNFNFCENPRYMEFNLPDESYHGLIYASAGAPAFAIKLRAQLIRDTGAIMSPQNAFYTNLGAETLALRMERTSRNAAEVAAFLEQSDAVEWVKHPSLASSPDHALAARYLPNGQGGMMSFGIKGGAEAAMRFMESLQMIKIVTHVADIRTCVLHPASTTHRQLSEEALAAAGISADLIRLSVGIEHVSDIIADLRQALQNGR